MTGSSETKKAASETSPYVVCGISFHESPVSLREKVAVPPDMTDEALEFLSRQPGVRECMILSTCNRTEICLSAEPWLDAGDLFARLALALRGVDLEEHRSRIYVHRGRRAVRHLFRVAAGLDSLVLGEPQILGQLKEAFRRAESAGVVGRDLHRWIPQCFRAARQVRTETGIGEAAVSVSYAAAQLARKIFEDLGGKKVVLLGAGKMSRLAAQHLKEAGVASILVCNRTEARARRLAADCGGLAVPFERRLEWIREADIVLCSTNAPAYILDPGTIGGIMGRRSGSPLLLLDISVPRNIDPAVADLTGVYLFNIDDLESVVEANRKARAREAARAEKMLAAAVAKFFRDESRDQVGPAIAAIRDQVRAICHDELDRVRHKSPALVREHEAELEVMLHRIAQKIVHPVICELKATAQREDPASSVRLIQSFFTVRREASSC